MDSPDASVLWGPAVDHSGDCGLGRIPAEPVLAPLYDKMGMQGRPVTAIRAKAMPRTTGAHHEGASPVYTVRTGRHHPPCKTGRALPPAERRADEAKRVVDRIVVILGAYVRSAHSTRVSRGLLRCHAVLLVAAVITACASGPRFGDPEDVAAELRKGGVPCEGLEDLGRDADSERAGCQLPDGAPLQLMVFDEVADRESFQSGAPLFLVGTTTPIAVGAGNVAVLVPDEQTASQVQGVLGGTITEAG